MARGKKDTTENVYTSDKQQAIATALASIERTFGKGVMVRLGDHGAMFKDIEVIPTGSIGLDIALGIGGIPRGRIVEIFGPESSGKTTLALHAIAEAQKTGGIAAFVDAEHALDVTYARKLGVRVDDLLCSQPDSGEQALEIVDTLVRSGRWTSSWSTRWRRWSPRPRSKARWATARSARRRG
jgi:recombination protein RecA